MNKLSPFTAKERSQLADLYDSLVGVISEYGGDFFDSYHKRNTKGMLNELEGILEKYASEELWAVLGI